MDVMRAYEYLFLFLTIYQLQRHLCNFTALRAILQQFKKSLSRGYHYPAVKEPAALLYHNVSLSIFIISSAFSSLATSSYVISAVYKESAVAFRT